MRHLLAGIALLFGVIACPMRTVKVPAPAPLALVKVHNFASSDAVLCSDAACEVRVGLVRHNSNVTLQLPAPLVAGQPIALHVHVAGVGDIALPAIEWRLDRSLEVVLGPDVKQCAVGYTGL